MASSFQPPPHSPPSVSSLLSSAFWYLTDTPLFWPFCFIVVPFFLPFVLLSVPFFFIFVFPIVCVGVAIFVLYKLHQAAFPLFPSYVHDDYELEGIPDERQRLREELALEERSRTRFSQETVFPSQADTSGALVNDDDEEKSVYFDSEEELPDDGNNEPTAGSDTKLFHSHGEASSSTFVSSMEVEGEGKYGKLYAGKQKDSRLLHGHSEASASVSLPSMKKQAGKASEHASSSTGLEQQVPSVPPNGHHVLHGGITASQPLETEDAKRHSSKPIDRFGEKPIQSIKFAAPLVAPIEDHQEFLDESSPPFIEECLVHVNVGVLHSEGEIVESSSAEHASESGRLDSQGNLNPWISSTHRLSMNGAWRELPAVGVSYVHEFYSEKLHVSHSIPHESSKSVEEDSPVPEQSIAQPAVDIPACESEGIIPDHSREPLDTSWRELPVVEVIHQLKDIPLVSGAQTDEPSSVGEEAKLLSEASIPLNETVGLPEQHEMPFDLDMQPSGFVGGILGEQGKSETSSVTLPASADATLAKADQNVSPGKRIQEFVQAEAEASDSAVAPVEQRAGPSHLGTMNSLESTGPSFSDLPAYEIAQEEFPSWTEPKESFPSVQEVLDMQEIILAGVEQPLEAVNISFIPPAVHEHGVEKTGEDVQVHPNPALQDVCQEHLNVDLEPSAGEPFSSNKSFIDLGSTSHVDLQPLKKEGFVPPLDKVSEHEEVSNQQRTPLDPSNKDVSAYKVEQEAAIEHVPFYPKEAPKAAEALNEVDVPPISSGDSSSKRKDLTVHEPEASLPFVREEVQDVFTSEAQHPREEEADKQPEKDSIREPKFDIMQPVSHFVSALTDQVVGIGPSVPEGEPQFDDSARIEQVLFNESPLPIPEERIHGLSLPQTEEGVAKTEQQFFLQEEEADVSRKQSQERRFQSEPKFDEVQPLIPPFVNEPHVPVLQEVIDSKKVQITPTDEELGRPQLFPIEMSPREEKVQEKEEKDVGSLSSSLSSAPMEAVFVNEPHVPILQEIVETQELQLTQTGDGSEVHMHTPTVPVHTPMEKILQTEEKYTSPTKKLQSEEKDKPLDELFKNAGLSDPFETKYEGTSQEEDKAAADLMHEKMSLTSSLEEQIPCEETLEQNIPLPSLPVPHVDVQFPFPTLDVSECEETFSSPIAQGIDSEEVHTPPAQPVDEASESEAIHTPPIEVLEHLELYPQEGKDLSASEKEILKNDAEQPAKQPEQMPSLGFPRTQGEVRNLMERIEASYQELGHDLADEMPTVVIRPTVGDEERKLGHFDAEKDEKSNAADTESSKTDILSYRETPLTTMTLQNSWMESPAVEVKEEHLKPVLCSDDAMLRSTHGESSLTTMAVQKSWMESPAFEVTEHDLKRGPKADDAMLRSSFCESPLTSMAVQNSWMESPAVEVREDDLKQGQKDDYDAMLRLSVAECPLTTMALQNSWMESPAVDLRQHDLKEGPSEGQKGPSADDAMLRSPDGANLPYTIDTLENAWKESPGVKVTEQNLFAEIPFKVSQNVYTSMADVKDLKQVPSAGGARFSNIIEMPKTYENAWRETPGVEVTEEDLLSKFTLPVSQTPSSDDVILRFSNGIEIPKRYESSWRETLGFEVTEKDILGKVNVEIPQDVSSADDGILRSSNGSWREMPGVEVTEQGLLAKLSLLGVHSSNISERQTQELEKRNILVEIDAINKIVGYQGDHTAPILEQIRSLYIFLGMEPLSWVMEVDDLDRARSELDLIKTVVGVK